MIPPATKSVASEVRQLARLHKVTSKRDGVSRMAGKISSLSGDTVVLDTVEQLLVNLKRKGVITTSDLLAMQVRYLEEKGMVERRTKKGSPQNS